MTWLDIVIFSLLAFGVATGGFGALIFLKIVVVVASGELNKLRGMVMTKGTAMEEDVEFEA